MKKHYLAALVLAAVGQSAIASDQNDAAYWSNVQYSFTAMLNHEPYSGPVAATAALGERDPVEAVVHAMMRGETFHAPRYAPETGFDRMLAHEPYAGETGVTVSVEQRDPVELAVHAALFPEGVHTAVALADPEAGKR